MNVQIELVLKKYEEKLAELQRENLLLKAQIEQMEINQANEEATKPEEAAN